MKASTEDRRGDGGALCVRAPVAQVLGPCMPGPLGQKHWVPRARCTQPPSCLPTARTQHPSLPPSCLAGWQGVYYGVFPGDDRDLLAAPASLWAVSRPQNWHPNTPTQWLLHLEMETGQELGRVALPSRCGVCGTTDGGDWGGAAVGQERVIGWQPCRSALSAARPAGWSAAAVRRQRGRRWGRHVNQLPWSVHRCPKKALPTSPGFPPAPTPPLRLCRPQGPQGTSPCAPCLSAGSPTMPCGGATRCTCATQGTGAWSSCGSQGWSW